MIIRRVRHNRHHERGAAAVLAMMFLVIFASLAAAMAIVSQGNLSTADAYLKINRSLAASETGMNFIIYQINQVTANVTTPWGLIDSDRAEDLWFGFGSEPGVRARLSALLGADFGHTLPGGEPVNTASGGLKWGPVTIGPGSPIFEVTFEPHPLPGPGGPTDYSRYDSAYYQRPPYTDLTLFPAGVSSTNPLDATWVRVIVTAIDGPNATDPSDHRNIRRSISMDFKLDKKLRFAILSRSRVMIGRNVIIQGAVGSRFMDTHLINGHPIQMASDFRGLDSALDTELDLFVNTLTTNDNDGDNRIKLSNATETAGITDPGQFDTNGDGYIDDYDFFFAFYDTNADGQVTAIELGTSGSINHAQFLELIDTFGDPGRAGYNDGVINMLDRYAKIRGQVLISAQLLGWLAGAAGGVYQDYFEGPIHADHDEAPLTFEADDNDLYQFAPGDFDTAMFAAMASGNLATQAAGQVGDPSDPDAPHMDLSGSQFEAVPFGARYPYDYIARPVYENMEFTNVTIPRGTNALFRNCKFIGATFIETVTDNSDPNFNYVGMQEADGTLKHPDLTAIVEGVEQADTKDVSNNIRFDDCTFEGAVASNAPAAFTHTRNKIAFTGVTKFADMTKVTETPNLTDDERELFRRSTILTPHYSVEMGTFVSPSDDTETVELSGTIVAGLIDMRGQINVNGSIITTFEPQVDVPPVIGNSSPQFNTTLGYFPSSAGDLEAELPASGIGVIHVRYDPTLPMPDGITGPIELRPLVATYFEGVPD